MPWLLTCATWPACQRVIVSPCKMPNGLTFPVAAFGVLKAGCVLVNVNPLYTSDEMAKQFEDSKPHALIIVDMFADKIPDATKGHSIPNIIVTRVAEFFPVLPRGIVGLVQKYWDKSIKPLAVPHTRLDALAAGRSGSPKATLMSMSIIRTLPVTTSLYFSTPVELRVSPKGRCSHMATSS